jgi:hypothetical protein
MSHEVTRKTTQVYLITVRRQLLVQLVYPRLQLVAEVRDPQHQSLRQNSKTEQTIKPWTTHAPAPTPNRLLEITIRRITVHDHYTKLRVHLVDLK